MNPLQLLTHFDRISEAPDAVTRLRRFILDLAVRGKLVDQDPNDEAASALLARVHAERVRLVKDGQIKNPDALPPIHESAKPFLLPKGWEWARFIDVAAIQSHLVDPKAHLDAPHIAPDNIESGTGRLLAYQTIGASAVVSSWCTSAMMQASRCAQPTCSLARRSASTKRVF